MSRPVSARCFLDAAQHGLDLVGAVQADMGDGMTIVATSRQLPWLRKTLASLLDGKTLAKVKPYAPWKAGKAPILIPLGPEKGNCFLVLFTAGDFQTRMMKGKDQFLAKHTKGLGRG